MDEPANAPLDLESSSDSLTSCQTAQDEDASQAPQVKICELNTVDGSDNVGHEVRSSNPEKRRNNEIEEEDRREKRQRVKDQVPTTESQINWRPQFMIQIKYLRRKYTKEKLSRTFLPSGSAGTTYFVPTVLGSRHYNSILCFEERKDAERAYDMLLDYPGRFLTYPPDSVNRPYNPRNSIKWIGNPQQLASPEARNEGDRLYQLAVLRAE